MLQKLDITGVHLEISPDLFDYAKKKIGKLDTYLPRHSRESAHGEVWLKHHKAKDKRRFTCEVVMQLPQDSVMVKESALTIEAAIDVAENKLKTQLKKYKELHSSLRIHRGVISRLHRA